MQNKTHALNDEVVVNALAGVVGVGVTYIKDDSDIVPLLKARQGCDLLSSWYRVTERVRSLLGVWFSATAAGQRSEVLPGKSPTHLSTDVAWARKCIVVARQ